jgi:X-X-X-Leu-X-X-Gly heptad repeat protein
VCRRFAARPWCGVGVGVQALAARVGKLEDGLADLSSSTQQIIGGISQLMSGFALRGSSKR